MHVSKTEKKEIFSVRDDGVEDKFTFTDTPVGFRPGSRILVVWGSETGTKSGPYYYVENLDTQEKSDVVPSLKLGIGFSLIFFAAIVAFFAAFISQEAYVRYKKFAASPQIRIEAERKVNDIRHPFKEYLTDKRIQSLINACAKTGSVRLDAFSDLSNSHDLLDSLNSARPIFRPAFDACIAKGANNRADICQCPPNLLLEIDKRLKEAKTFVGLKAQAVDKLTSDAVKEVAREFWGSSVVVGGVTWLVGGIVILVLLALVKLPKARAARSEFFENAVAVAGVYGISLHFDRQNPVKLLRG